MTEHKISTFTRTTIITLYQVLSMHGFVNYLNLVRSSVSQIIQQYKQVRWRPFSGKAHFQSV